MTRPFIRSRAFIFGFLTTLAALAALVAGVGLAYSDNIQVSSGPL